MKKVRLFLISCVALLGSCTEDPKDIEINEKNFPDEGFRAWISEQDYGKDGVLTAEEIAGIDTIEIDNDEPKNLKGIEYFSALKVLYCPLLELTELDLSKNTELTELLCEGGQLTALDVSGCTKLTELRCNDNKLTELNVSKNTALIALHCYSNQLTALDVSKNTALESLFCYSNQLTALDMSGCTALEWVDCGENQLTTLDVSGCTALTELDCFENYIRDDRMDALLKSLPTVNDGILRVVDNKRHWDEGNRMTPSQVEAAKAKGWTSYNLVWQEYAGEDK